MLSVAMRRCIRLVDDSAISSDEAAECEALSVFMAVVACMYCALQITPRSPPSYQIHTAVSCRHQCVLHVSRTLHHDVNSRLRAAH